MQLPCTARELLTWMDDNVDSATHVANKVVSGLEKCFSSKARNPRTRRDKMFTKFYGLRSSKEYRVFWSKIMRDSIGQTAPCPTFYQFVVCVYGGDSQDQVSYNTTTIRARNCYTATGLQRAMWSPIYIRSSNKSGQKNSEYFCKVKGEEKGTVVLP